MEVEEKPVKIMKELPKKVLQIREEYRNLTEKLKDQNIKFRWEIPESVSFWYKGTRISIRNMEQKEFLLEHQKDFEFK